jgi:hypothetical protein
MTTNKRYPESLLVASVAERLKYFDQAIVSHPRLRAVVERVDQCASPFKAKRLVMVVGGSGVGKSAALKKVACLRNARRQSDIADNPDIVPALFIEVEAPDKGKFSFSSLYLSILQKVNAALPTMTIPLVKKPSKATERIALGVEFAGKLVRADALKERVKSNLIVREINLLCLDEAANLFKVGRYRSAEDRRCQLKEQADKLKTFVNKTDTTIVLIGAYDFFELALVSGQIVRRSTIVHMTPYSESKEDLVGFMEALVGLLAHLPINHSIQADTHAAELLLQCLGCIGVLKDILQDALSDALVSNTDLTMDIVRRNYYSAAQLAVLRDELESGDAAVNDLMKTTTFTDQANDLIALSNNEIDKSRGSGIKKLKPGETKPSHRKEAASTWSTS